MIYGKYMGTPKRRRGLIILADDDGDMRELAASALAEVAPGVDLLLVTSGAELREALTTQAVDEKASALRQPTIVLLDIEMPEQSGFVVLREIRADPLIRRVPVIALTVSDEAEDVGSMYDLGVNAFLTKPAGYEGLRALLARVVAFWFETANVKEGNRL